MFLLEIHLLPSRDTAKRCDYHADTLFVKSQLDDRKQCPLFDIYFLCLTVYPLPFIIVYLDYLTMLCSLALSPSVSLANAYLKKRPSHMKAGGSRTSCVLMEGSFYPYRCVCVSILRFGPSA